MQLIGKLTLNRNPANYFAETEQVAFHTGNLVPGIEVTNDPLMQARLFSYLDTQLTRLGGPNFTQLPINQPHCPVNDMLRDGMHQTAVPAGLAPYRPNSIDGGEPLVATAEEGGYVQTPRPVEGPVVRSSPVSFGDHFTQPAMFYRSLTPLEQAHLVEAFTFELGKCYEQAIKERELQVLANVDADLCAQVAAGLGLPAPDGQPGRRRGPVARPVADRHRARPDRRPQDRHHRRRRRRPGRHRHAPQGGRQTRRDRPGHRPRRRCPWQRRRQGNGRPDAADHPLGRVRRPRRRRRHHPGRRHQADRPPAGGVPPLQGAGRLGQRNRDPGSGRHHRRRPGSSDERRGRRSPSPTSSPPPSACTGPGTGRPPSWPLPFPPSSPPDHPNGST